MEISCRASHNVNRLKQITGGSTWMTPLVYPRSNGSANNTWCGFPSIERKILFEETRKELESVLRELTKHRESETLRVEGRMLLDHVHMLVAIPQKYIVSQVVGVHDGQECDSCCPDVSGARAKFHRTTSLGEGLLHINSWTRHSPRLSMPQCAGAGSCILIGTIVPPRDSSAHRGQISRPSEA